MAVARRRTRRTNKELFVDKLRELSGEDQPLVGNGALRNALDWDEERYARIKGELHSENAIIIGRGRGGSVGLVDAPGSQPLKVFVSYSHADDALKTELISHLKPLERMNLVSEWHDRKLRAGDEWDAEISANLETADVILLLVSIDFINSRYCYDVEMERALERHAQGSAKVVPIILRSCMWQYTAFSKLQALPKDARAISSWPDKDEAFASVADGIRLLAEEVLAQR